MRKVVLSKRATLRLEKLLRYLETEWSLKTKNEFIRKLDKSVEQIRLYPEIGLETGYIAGLRKYVVTKQISLYYKYNQKSVFIVTIFDNRMDTDKIKKEIK
jgi:plasmid stabilization system protein ParE